MTQMYKYSLKYFYRFKYYDMENKYYYMIKNINYRKRFGYYDKDMYYLGFNSKKKISDNSIFNRINKSLILNKSKDDLIIRGTNLSNSRTNKSIGTSDFNLLDIFIPSFKNIKNKDLTKKKITN